MNLPFSPTFFKKIDIYQNLRDYQKESKETWPKEKEVLITWVSNNKFNRGDRVTTDRVIELTESALENKKISNENTKAGEEQVLRSLVSRGFAEVASHGPIGAFYVRITQRGFDAGEILVETKNLSETVLYHFWIGFWYAIIVLGFLLLLSETGKSIANLL